MTNQDELFDSDPYYVPPPPTKLRVEVDVWSKSFEIELKGTLLELYNTWKETERADDEETFAAWMVDDIFDLRLIDLSLSDWEEV